MSAVEDGLYIDAGLPFAPLVFSVSFSMPPNFSVVSAVELYALKYEFNKSPFPDDEDIVYPKYFPPLSFE